MTGMMVQPANRGTGAGILLPLLRILRRNRDAVVVILPADQYVADETTLGFSLARAVSLVERGRRVVLLGMAPDGPDPDYGWIVGGGADEDGTRPIISFVEKPSPRGARELYRSGAAISSFIVVGRGRALLALFQAETPGLLAALARVPEDRAKGIVPDAAVLQRVYESLPEVDFSRDVLQRSATHLRLLAVPPCGWTDLGTPERLERWIRSREDGEAGRHALLRTTG